MSSGAAAQTSKALKALRAARESRASRRRALDSSEDDAKPAARRSRRASAPSEPSPVESSEHDEVRRASRAACGIACSPGARVPLPTSTPAHSACAQAELVWEHRQAARVRRTGSKDYQYRKHVTGLRLERPSDDESGDSLSDFVVSGSGEDEDEDEDEEAEEEQAPADKAVAAPVSKRPGLGAGKRLRRPAAAAVTVAPPAATVAADTLLEDDDADEAVAAGKDSLRRRSLRVLDDTSSSEEDIPLRSLHDRRKRSESAVSDDDAAYAAAGGPAKKRLRRAGQTLGSAERAQRREPNERQARAQDALARLVDLRGAAARTCMLEASNSRTFGSNDGIVFAGKDRSARRVEEQLRATQALPAEIEESEESESEDADAFCCSEDSDGEGRDDGGGGEDDGVVACVCGASRIDDDDDSLLVQCSNNMCRVWQHAACVGLQMKQEEIEEAVFFCARCSPAARALLADGATLDASGFVPVAGVGAEISPSEADTRAWRAVHGARDVGAAIAGSLAGDRAAQLSAILKHSRPGALRLALTHKNGVPLLCRAAEAGAVECARLLLRNQTLPVPEGCMGNPVAAFCTALEAKQLEVARALLQGVPGLLALSARAGAYEEGGTAVHAAATSGCVDCLRLALPPGQGGIAAVGMHDNEGVTPLMLAAASPGGTPAVAFLLALVSGATKELSRVDSQGRNACHYAASSGQAASVAALIAACPSIVHGHDSEGSTPLHLAAAEGRGDVIRVLLRSGASVTSKDHAGWVPLMYSTVSDVEGTNALLEHQPELQLTAMAGQLGAPHSETRVLKILRGLAETPAFFSTLNSFLRPRIGLLSGSLSFLLRRPAVLDVGNKQRWFQTHVAAYLRSRPTDVDDDSSEESDEEAGLFWVSREAAFDDWAAWVSRCGPAALARPMWRKLRLLDAPASFGSGVEREVLELMAAALANRPELFAPTAEGGRLLAPVAGTLTEARRASYTAVGWLLGYSLLHGRNLPLPLELPFLRTLLGRKLSGELMDALESVDPIFARSLSSMLATQGAADLGLCFVLEEGDQTVELIPNGAAVSITDENKEQFAAAVCSWKLIRRTADACAAIRDGISQVFPTDLLRVFTEADLGLMIAGAGDIDLTDWQANTRYDGCQPSDPLIQWFWMCVRKMSREERALLLKLVTGSSRVPPSGFASLQGLSGPQLFTVMCVTADSDRLPTSSTCFNTLKMPRYSSYAQLEQRLLAAVRFGSGGFEFV